MEFRSLVKNLEELEWKIKSIFAGEEDKDVYRQRFMELADEIERRVGFLKNQIAAESASRPNSPDRNLSRAARRFDELHSAISSLKNNLLPGLPFNCPHYFEDEVESCFLQGEGPQHDEEDEDESCSIHGEGEVEDVPTTTTFTVYSNPLASASSSDGDGEENKDDNEGGDREMVEKSVDGKGWFYWRPMLLGGLLGGLTVTAAVASVVWCQFSSDSISAFPPPT